MQPGIPTSAPEDSSCEVKAPERAWSEAMEMEISHGRPKRYGLSPFDLWFIWLIYGLSMINLWFISIWSMVNLWFIYD